ncbi:hypothetical protein ACHAPU_003230 [Fusarium lateritium]
MSGYPWEYSGPRNQFFQDHIMRQQGLFRFLLSELNSELPVLQALTDQPSTGSSLMPYFTSNPSASMPGFAEENNGRPITPISPPEENYTVVSHPNDSFVPHLSPELNTGEGDHRSPDRADSSSICATVEQWEDSDIRAPETRSALALHLDRLADRSAQLQCVEDEYFDAITVAFLVNALDSHNSRQRLFCFLDDATLDVWYCLDEVTSKTMGNLTPIDSLQNGCSSHDYNCTLVKVAENTSHCRRLQFQHFIGQE